MNNPAVVTESPEGWSQRWIALGFLGLVLIVLAIDMTVLNFAIPSISADLHPTPNQLLWIIDV